MAQSGGPAALGHVSDLLAGGACAWRLPSNANCASVSRSLLGMAMTTIGLTGDTADAAVLAVSELATNALRHGLRAGPGHAPVVPPELWVWARAIPAPQLVVSVFDSCRRAWPDTSPRDLLDEHGRGIEIVGLVAEMWGAHLSRSRLATSPVPGKAVWAAFALPAPSPHTSRTVAPSVAARHLAAALAARGITGIDRHQDGISLVSVPLPGSGGGGAMNVWVGPSALCFIDVDGTRMRRPIVDLHDLAEHLVRRVEESGSGPAPRCP